MILANLFLSMLNISVLLVLIYGFGKAFIDLYIKCSHYHLHIFPDVSLELWISQKERRMVGGHEFGAMEVMKLSPQ